MKAAAFRGGPQRREVRPGDRITPIAAADTGNERSSLLSSWGAGSGKNGPVTSATGRARGSGAEQVREDPMARATQLGLKRAPKAHSPEPENMVPPPLPARSRSSSPGPTVRPTPPPTSAPPPHLDDFLPARERSSSEAASRSRPSMLYNRSEPSNVPSPSSEPTNSKVEAKPAATSLFGSLWTKTAQVFGGAAAIDELAEGEGKRAADVTGQNPEEKLPAPHSTITPFVIEKPLEGKGEEKPEGKKEEDKDEEDVLNGRRKSLPPISSRTASSELVASSSSNLRPSKSEPRRAPVVPPLPAAEPITFKRPPPTHPRDYTMSYRRPVTLAGVTTPHDWLTPRDMSPLEPYLFHRAAGRAATRRGRGGRPAMAHTRTDPGPPPPAPWNTNSTPPPQGIGAPHDRRYTLADPSNATVSVEYSPHAQMMAAAQRNQQIMAMQEAQRQMHLQRQQHQQTPYPSHPNQFHPPTSQAIPPPGSAPPAGFFPPPNGILAQPPPVSFAPTHPSPSSIPLTNVPTAPVLAPNGAPPLPHSNGPVAPVSISSAAPTGGAIPTPIPPPSSLPQAAPVVAYGAIPHSQLAQPLQAFAQHPFTSPPNAPPVDAVVQQSLPSFPPGGYIQIPPPPQSPPTQVQLQGFTPRDSLTQGPQQPGLPPAFITTPPPIQSAPPPPPLASPHLVSNGNDAPFLRQPIPQFMEQTSITVSAPASVPLPPSPALPPTSHDAATQELPRVNLEQQSVPGQDDERPESRVPTLSLDTSESPVTPSAGFLVTPPTPISGHETGETYEPMGRQEIVFETGEEEGDEDEDGLRSLVGEGIGVSVDDAAPLSIAETFGFREGEGEEEEQAGNEVHPMLSLPPLELEWSLPDLGLGLDDSSLEAPSSFFGSLGGSSTELKTTDNGQLPFPVRAPSPLLSSFPEEFESVFDPEEDEAAGTLIDEAFDATTNFVRTFSESSLPKLAEEVEDVQAPASRPSSTEPTPDRMSAWLNEQRGVPVGEASFSALPLSAEEEEDDDVDSLGGAVGDMPSPGLLGPTIYRPRTAPTSANGRPTLGPYDTSSAFTTTLPFGVPPTRPTHTRSVSFGSIFLPSTDLDADRDLDAAPSPTNAALDNIPVLFRPRAVSLNERSGIFGGSVTAESSPAQMKAEAPIEGSNKSWELPPITAKPIKTTSTSTAMALAALSNSAFKDTEEQKKAEETKKPTATYSFLSGGSVAAESKRESESSGLGMDDLFANW